MIENTKTKQQYDLSNSLILSGTEVCQLPQELLEAYYKQISEELAKNSHTMNQYSSRQLRLAVESGSSVVAIDAVSAKLLGFVQIKRDAKQRLELSSWLGLVPGIGRPLLIGGAALADDLDPEAPVVARVRKGNHGAEKVIMGMGGSLVGHETSQYPNPDTLQPYQKNIYDVSLRTLLPQHPLKTKLEICPQEINDATNGGFLRRIHNNVMVRKLRWLISTYLPKH